MFEYNCKVRRVVDGDTIDIDIDLGFNHWIHGERIRLAGIDTPECRTKDDEEKIFGNLAKQFVLEWVDAYGPDFRIKTTDKDKFGRYLGKIISRKGEVLNESLVVNHLAVEYDGSAKELIAAKHIENRSLYVKNNYDHEAIIAGVMQNLWGDNED